MGDKAVEIAKKTLGSPFQMGAEGPDKFDTSGLIYYCFKELGIKVPRGVNAQSSHGTKVAFKDLKPGDVVFFWLDTKGKAEYVGIYVNEDTFIAARNSKYPVSQRDFTSYFKEHFVTARRYW